MCNRFLTVLALAYVAVEIIYNYDALAEIAIELNLNDSLSSQKNDCKIRATRSRRDGDNRKSN